MSMVKISLQVFTIPEIMAEYSVSRRTAFRFKKQGYAVVREYPVGMPEGIDYQVIARRSALYIGASQRDWDLLDEMTQQARIDLWKAKAAIETSRSAEHLAHDIARKSCLRTLHWWRLHRHMPLDDYLAKYEDDGEGIDAEGPSDSADLM